MPTTPLANPSQSKAVQFFARSIGKAVARFGILFGVPVGTMFQVIKEGYVEVATEMLKEKGQDPADSKIAIMTGISRKSVPAARTPKDCWEAVPVTNLLGYWVRTLKFQDQNGKPAELPVQARDEPSFSELVKEFCGRDITVGSVLDYLETSGNIERTDYGTVRLLSTWASSEDLELAITFGANALAWHADTVIDNLQLISLGDKKTLRLSDRKRYSRSIPNRLVPTLAPKFDKIFSDVDKILEEAIDKAEVSQEALDTCIFGAGWFLFRQPTTKQ